MQEIRHCYTHASRETPTAIAAVYVPRPDTCPSCHQGIDARYLVSYLYQTPAGAPVRIDAFFCCTRAACRDRVFIARYELDQDSWTLKECVPKTVELKSFDPVIVKTSPQFAELFGQAQQAEEIGLRLICGPGYRKALEFLVKDFSKVGRSEAERDQIEKMKLGDCIKKFTGGNVQAMAERAIWLGNDETHYVRKWADKDIDDLKNLIGLTVHWIVAEDLTKKLTHGMPKT